LVEVQSNAFTDVFLEAGLSDVNFVTAYRYFNKDIFPVLASLHFAIGVSGFVDQLDLGSGHGGATGVRDSSANASAGALRGRARCQNGQRDNRSGQARQSGKFAAQRTNTRRIVNPEPS